MCNPVFKRNLWKPRAWLHASKLSNACGRGQLTCQRNMYRKQFKMINLETGMQEHSFQWCQHSMFPNFTKTLGWISLLPPHHWNCLHDIRGFTLSNVNRISIVALRTWSQQLLSTGHALELSNFWRRHKLMQATTEEIKGALNESLPNKRLW